LACVPTIPAVVAAPVAAPALADFSIERLLALEKSVAEMKIVPNPNYHGMAPQMGHHYGPPLGMGMGPAHHPMAFNVHGMYPPSGMFPQPPYPYGLMHHGGFDHRRGQAPSTFDGSADSQDTAGALTVPSRGGWPSSWGQQPPSGP
jgi:hypothetical protein